MSKGPCSMNVLLVNNDAVVTKLVTLSTQKTGDRLDIARDIDEVRDESYDLLILDGGLFDRAFLEALNDKAIYAHSIFITTRENPDEGLFEKVLYKPFLPTELLVLLHQFATSVQKEQELLAQEIVFDDFEENFFSDDEIVSDSDVAEQEALEDVQSFEAVEEAAPLKESQSEEIPEEEVLENIFSEQEVSEVKSILEALNSDENEAAAQEILDEVSSEEEHIEDDVDLELERALQNLTHTYDVTADVEKSDFGPTSIEKVADVETEPPSQTNQESIETLKTLVKALENPQIAKSLRGTITINLTFGEEQ